MTFLTNHFQQTQTQNGTIRHAKRVGLCFALIVGLAACATGPKNPMTATQIKSLDIDVVDVTVFPGTQISWGAGEEAFAETKGCEKPEPVTSAEGDNYGTAAAENQKQDCDYDAIVNSPEAQDYMEARVVEFLENAIRAEVVPAFQGTAPARLEVKVQKVQVVGGGQTLLVGGNHFLLAPLNVVDLKSGKTIAANPEALSVAGTASGGILGLIIEAASSDPVERLAGAYAINAKKWIVGGN